MISNLLIFNTEYSLYLSNDYGSDIQSNMFNLNNFLEALVQFADDSLKSELVSLEIDNELILLMKGKQLSFTISLKVGNKVSIGKNSKVITDLEALCDILEPIVLDNLTMTSDTILIKDKITEEVTKINEKSMKTAVDQSDNSIDIAMVLITDPFGIPRVAQAYNHRNLDNDPILVSSLIHALQLYFNMTSTSKLKSIQFGTSKLYLRWYQRHCYGVLVNFDSDLQIAESNPINKIGNELIDSLIQSVNIMGSLDGVDSSILDTMVNTFVVESEYQIP